MFKRLALIPILVSCLIAPGIPVGHAYEEGQYWNDYSVVGLEGYTTGPRSFTVEVDGPLPVCSMTYNGTQLTSVPWTFTYYPTTLNRVQFPWLSTQVDIELCSGEKDFVSLDPEIPFRFLGRIVAKSGFIAFNEKPSVENQTSEVAVVTVTDKNGKVVFTDTAQPNSTVTVKLPDSKRTERYTVKATSESGVSMSSIFARPKGWSLSLGAATIEPCSQVTWAYDASRAPQGAKTFKKDIVASLDILSKETGLTFLETGKFADAQLRYSWESMIPAGMGGTDGSIAFNPKSSWVLERHAGFKPFKPYGTGTRKYFSGPSGRGWLIVHETMHALGFDHVDNPKSIMAPINRGQGKFTRDDRDGLHTMYRSHC